MQKAILVVFVLSVVGLSTGCNKAKNEVLSDGTKILGERILKDGTKVIERVELPNGVKKFNKSIFPDGTEKDERIEHPNGYKQFVVTFLPDGTQKTERSESLNGDKSFGITLLRDGTMKEELAETASGQKQFDLTGLPDGTTRSARVEYPNGEKWFDVTVTPDGTQKAGQIELPNGVSLLDVTQRDGNRKFKRVLLPTERSVTGSVVAQPTVSKSDSQTGSVAPNQIPKEEQERAERENGEPIAYIDFYMKAKTGLQIGKRYRFVADVGSQPLCLHPMGYLEQATFDTQHILCGLVPAFDDPAEHDALLRAGTFHEATVVASMGAAGNVSIHKVRGR